MLLLVRCRYGHVILHPSKLIVFPLSHWPVHFLPCSLLLAFQQDLLGFSQKEKALSQNALGKSQKDLTEKQK